jgi:hypothetical protein
LAVGLEQLVLDDDRDVVDAVAVRQRQARCQVIIDDEHASQAAVDLVRGAPVWVRVIPEGGARLADGPAR